MNVAALPERPVQTPRLRVQFTTRRIVARGVHAVNSASLPCDVLLGVHGYFYGVTDKYERAQDGPVANPFIDPQGYRHFLAEAERRFRAHLAAERR
ncbi:MAG: hypothetical protein ABUS79_08275 [Pseudomonadota bacterium]